VSRFQGNNSPIQLTGWSAIWVRRVNAQLFQGPWRSSVPAYPYKRLLLNAIMYFIELESQGRG
jgi:hypothetical protein